MGKYSPGKCARIENLWNYSECSFFKKRILENQQVLYGLSTLKITQNFYLRKP